jgi:hypothetical protein
MIPAEVFYSVIKSIIFYQTSTKTKFPQVFAPHGICRRHIFASKSIGRQSTKYFVPFLPGGFANGPDGAVTHTAPGWVWVIVFVLAHSLPILGHKKQLSGNSK